MKSLAKFEQKIGGDGAELKGNVGIDASDVVAQVEIRYPLAKVIDPVMGVVDGLVDKLEKLIPGDQTGLAAQAKIDARAAIVKALSEAPQA